MAHGRLIQRDLEESGGVLEELTELESIDQGKLYAAARVTDLRLWSTCSATWGWLGNQAHEFDAATSARRRISVPARCASRSA